MKIFDIEVETAEIIVYTDIKRVKAETQAEAEALAMLGEGEEMQTFTDYLSGNCEGSKEIKERKFNPVIIKTEEVTNSVNEKLKDLNRQKIELRNQLTRLEREILNA